MQTENELVLNFTRYGSAILYARQQQRLLAPDAV